MDDFLGTSIIAAAAATRMKLYREGNLVNMYAKTRYTERPDKISLVWKNPLLVVTQDTLKPREEAKHAIIQLLQSDRSKEYSMGELTSTIAGQTGHNVKTVRQALDNLALEEKVDVSRVPKSAIKKVKLLEEVEIYAS
jgi:hypothetical protein